MWCPDAVKLPFRGSGGGSMLTATPRGVLHTTEANHYSPSTTSYYGSKNPPHFTVTRGGVAFQHYPTHTAARALLHPAGTVDTNRMNAYQIEIVGYARASSLMPEIQEAKLKQVMRWVEATTGVRRISNVRFGGSETYGPGPHRLSEDGWRSAEGWLGHQHVVSNVHWDPGRINMTDLLTVKWATPGDPVDSKDDAVRVARFQGGDDQARLVEQQDHVDAVMSGRILSLLMQHDSRLEKGKL